MANPYAITEEFEKSLCAYTGAPYAVAVDCCGHAIFLALKWFGVDGMRIHLPERTFPSVPCEVIHAGGQPVFYEIEGRTLKGEYRLEPTNVWDSALRFTSGMYKKGQMQCLSFTGPRKHLKLIKGGAILTDSKDAYEWFKSMRMSGRHECDFMTDEIIEPGWNFYLLPEISARALTLMREFYDSDRNPIPNEDRELEYPLLTEMRAFK